MDISEYKDLFYILAAIIFLMVLYPYVRLIARCFMKSEKFVSVAIFMLLLPIVLCDTKYSLDGDRISIQDFTAQITLPLSPEANPITYVIPTPEGLTGKVSTPPLKIFVKSSNTTYHTNVLGWTSAFDVTVGSPHVKCCGTSPTPEMSWDSIYSQYPNTTIQYTIFPGVYHCLWGGASCFCCHNNHQTSHGLVYPNFNLYDPTTYAHLVTVTAASLSVELCIILDGIETCHVVSTNSGVRYEDEQYRINVSPASSLFNPLPDRLVVHNSRIYDTPFDNYGSASAGTFSDCQSATPLGTFATSPRDWFCPVSTLTLIPPTKAHKNPYTVSSSGFLNWKNSHPHPISSSTTDGMIFDVITNQFQPSIVGRDAQVGFLSATIVAFNKTFDYVYRQPIITNVQCTNVATGVFGGDVPSTLLVTYYSDISLVCDVTINRPTNVTHTKTNKGSNAFYAGIHTQDIFDTISYSICGNPYSCDAKSKRIAGHFIISKTQHRGNDLLSIKHVSSPLGFLSHLFDGSWLHTLLSAIGVFLIIVVLVIVIKAIIALLLKYRKKNV